MKILNSPSSLLRFDSHLRYIWSLQWERAVSATFFHQAEKSQTWLTAVTSQHIPLLPCYQLWSQFLQHQIFQRFFFCSSLSLYINFRLWTQNKSPWWEWSLKAWVIYILIVPHAFPFKIFGLRTWEVRNLYFEVFIKHSIHPLIYAPWDLFYVKHLTSYTLDKRNIWSIGCFGASHSFLPYIFIKFKCQAQYFKFKTLPLVPKFSFL